MSVNTDDEIQMFTFCKKLSTFMCCECEYSTSRLTMICRHFVKDHVKKKREETSSFKCPKCAYTHSDLQKVREHVSGCLQHGNDYTYALASSENVEYLSSHISSENSINVLNNDQVAIVPDTPLSAVQMNTVNSEKSSGSEDKSFCCDICQKRFDLKRVLLNHFKRIHLRKHVPEIACSVCSATFLHQHSLTVHRQTAHHVNTGDNASLMQNKRQRILHHFKCLTCSFYSYDSKRLRKHALKCNHKKGVCPVCKKCFTKKRDFNFHIKTSHNGASSQRGRRCNFVHEDDIEQILNSCNRTTKNSESLNNLKMFLKRMKECFGSASCKHFSRYSEISEFINSEFRPVYLKAKFTFKCCFCDHEHPEISGLTRHFKECHMKIYGCKDCSLVYRERLKLREHRKTRHIKRVKKLKESRPRSFVCEFCGKGFSNMSALKGHKKFKHNQGEHVCKICKAVFPDYSKLKSHLVKHERGSFYCSVCGKEFKRKSDVYNHENTVHCPEEKKRHCQMCDFKTSTAAKLKQHMNIHTGQLPYECPVCGMRFRQGPALHRHQLTHTKEQKHSCPVCGQKFSQGCSMKRHLLTHDKIKPFQCGVCEALYSQLYPLKQHLKKKHPEADIENSIVRIKT